MKNLTGAALLQEFLETLWSEKTTRLVQKMDVADNGHTPPEIIASTIHRLSAFTNWDLRMTAELPQSFSDGVNLCTTISRATTCPMEDLPIYHSTEDLLLIVCGYLSSLLMLTLRSPAENLSAAERMD